MDRCDMDAAQKPRIYVYFKCTAFGTCGASATCKAVTPIFTVTAEII